MDLIFHPSFFFWPTSINAATAVHDEAEKPSQLNTEEIFEIEKMIDVLLRIHTHQAYLNWDPNLQKRVGVLNSINEKMRLQREQLK